MLDEKNAFKSRFEQFMIDCKAQANSNSPPSPKPTLLKRLYLAAPKQVRDFSLVRSMRRSYLGKREDPGSRLFALSFANYLLNSPDDFVHACMGFFDDAQSRKNAAYFLDYMLECAFSGKFPVPPHVYGQELYSKIKKEGENYRFGSFLLPLHNFIPEVFVHHHGLKMLPKEALLRIRDSDVLDVGASFGDSALVLSQYTDSLVHSFECDAGIFAQLQKTIALNSLQSKVLPIKEAVGEKCGTVLFDGFPRDFYFHHGQEPLFSSSTISLDSYLEGKSNKVGLIKMDVEGFELEVLKGAKAAIKKHKPVVLAAAYHTGKDFFEIPKFLRSIHPDYKFRLFLLNEEYAAKEAVIAAY